MRTEDDQDRTETGWAVGANEEEPMAMEEGQIVKATYQSSEVAIEGPLPPPQTLDGYEKTLPGAADRIFSMAEKEQSHRHNMEKDVNNKLAFDKRLAQTYAFTLTLAALSGAVYLLSTDKAVEGIIVFISSFIPIAKSYLDLKAWQDRDDLSEDE